MGWTTTCSLLLCAAVLIACTWYGIWSSRLPFQCEMTFMYPRYDRVFTKGRYSLYQYHEKVLPGGRKEPKNGYMPALFLPGNSGSYKQVRSIAGETARQFRKRHAALDHDLTWFVADFNEEFSAFDGHHMVAQTDFVVGSLIWLQELFKDQNDFRLVVVGHSMGGLIARAALKQGLAEDSIAPESVAAILTLASPHQQPPVLTQPAMAKFYSDLLRGECEKQVPLISIYGGARDLQVPFALIRFAGLITDPGCPRLEVAMSDIPAVWVEADHQCIVWCNQLILRLASLIIDWTNGLPWPKGINDRSTHAERIIAQCQTEFGPVSTRDLESGSAEDIKTFGPVCQKNIPDVVSQKMDGAYDDGSQGDALFVDQAVLQENPLHNSTGTAWSWDWRHGNRTTEGNQFSLFIGSAQPCVSFRAWVVGVNGTAEITGMVYSLPPASDLAKVKPLPDTPAALQEILRGRDYYAGAFWYLPLDANQLEGVQRLVVWVGQPSLPHAFALQALVFQPSTNLKPVLGLRNAFWRMRIPARVPMPVEIRVSQWVWGLFRVKVGAVSHGCTGKAGLQRSAWQPTVVGPPDARLGGKNQPLIPTFHVLAQFGCNLDLWLEVPMAELMTEYLLVKSGQLMGLCLCLTAWGLLHSRRPPKQPPSVLATQNLSESPPHAGMASVLTNLGLVGFVWIGFVVIGSFKGSRGFHLITGWPVWWGVWSQPLDTRYPGIYACMDSISAFLLVALSTWLVEKVICALAWLMYGLSHSRMAHLFLSQSNSSAVAPHREAYLSQPGVKMKIFLFAMAALHPGISSLIAFGTLATAWQSVQGKSGQKERALTLYSDLIFHFWGLLLWLPSLIAWLRVAPFHTTWFFSDVPLWLPCIIHGLHFEKRLSSSRSRAGLILVNVCLTLALVMILDGYSSVAVYLYSVTCLLDLLSSINTVSQNQAKEE